MQKLVQIQPRTSPLKFDHLVEKFGVKYGIVSFNLATDGSKISGAAAAALATTRAMTEPKDPPPAMATRSRRGASASIVPGGHAPLSSDRQVFCVLSFFYTWAHGSLLQNECTTSAPSK